VYCRPTYYKPLICKGKFFKLKKVARTSNELRIYSAKLVPTSAHILLIRLCARPGTPCKVIDLKRLSIDAQKSGRTPSIPGRALFLPPKVAEMGRRWTSAQILWIRLLARHEVKYQAIDLQRKFFHAQKKRMKNTLAGA
jgi:hypothetical protein